MTRPGPRDQGAIATIVALLFGCGVMLACAALTIDVGAINLDRRQLQNGADAAALSAAQDCALSACPAANDVLLGNLADGNAADGATKVARVDGGLAVCGTGPGLSACTTAADTSKLQECPTPKLPSPSTPYVRVFTQTQNAAKTATLLPYTFGATIAGAGSGANQQTCASAAWGPPGSYTSSVPLTFSYCEWNRATADGTNYGPQPSGAYPFYGGAGQQPWPAAATSPPAAPLPGEEVIIYLQSHEPRGYDSGCNTWNGHDAPGSFGWVNSASCMATVTSDNWVQTDNGGDTPNPCKDVMNSVWKTVIFLPVFDCVASVNPGPPVGGVPNPLPDVDWCTAGNGANTYYHIKGWARFYLSGYHLPSADKVSPASGRVPCNGADRCISGWFLEGLVDAPVVYTPGDPYFGVQAIQVVG